MGDSRPRHEANKPNHNIANNRFAEAWHRFGEYNFVNLGTDIGQTSLHTGPCIELLRN